MGQKIGKQEAGKYETVLTHNKEFIEITPDNFYYRSKNTKKLKSKGLAIMAFGNKSEIGNATTDKGKRKEKTKSVKDIEADLAKLIGHTFDPEYNKHHKCLILFGHDISIWVTKDKPNALTVSIRDISNLCVSLVEYYCFDTDGLYFDIV